MKSLHNKKGQSIVETALVLPIILLVVFGIIDFGRIFNAQIILSNSAREGSRYAALGKTDAEITIAVDSMCTTLGAVTTNINPLIRVQGEKVTVIVEHDLSLITPFAGPLISATGSIHLKASNTMRVE